MYLSERSKLDNILIVEKHMKINLLNQMKIMQERWKTKNQLHIPNQSFISSLSKLVFLI